MEFKEVMRIWRRFCQSHAHCGQCEWDGKGICGDGHLSKVSFNYMEEFLKKWNEEHREPVYPTWIEWLQQKGVIGKTRKDRIGGIAATLIVFNEIAHEPIPADLAQKLGLKPKGN